MPVGTVVSRGYLADVDGVSGRVRATFERCAYVTVDGGPALVLHAAGGDHAPTSLCPAIWPRAVVAVGDPVAGRARHLKVGELVLDVRAARVWRPAAPAPAERLAAEAIGSGGRVALRAAGRRTGGLLPALERALAGCDAEGVSSGVASLIGRGPGLTPSGDDALVGMLAVLHRLARTGEGWRAQPTRHGPAPQVTSNESATRLLERAVLEHLHRTGDISAHYLRLAVAGHFGERLVALCDALAAGDFRAIAAAADAVAATGATSGADALLGVVSGVRLVAASCDLAVAA